VAEAAVLEIRCFGHFEVLRGGTPVQRWRRDRARVLLKYLVVQGRPVARDALLEFLWPGVPTSHAAGHLRVVLHALRQALGTWSGNDYVRSESDRLVLDPAAPVWLDTEAFMLHVDAAEALVRQNRTGAAMQAYTDAERIYRGDYLVEDAPERWTLLRREELKDRYQVVLTRLADYCLETNDLVGTIDRCHKLLAQDNCREDAYQRLMYCHAALGQRSRALRWYEMCQIALRNELGRQPGQATRTLHDRIAADGSVSQGAFRLRSDRPIPVDGRDA
jgi:DNA-binding SARP family transcriptional activator